MTAPRVTEDLSGVDIDHRQPPEFRLEPLYDDNENPTEVTICDLEADEEKLKDLWITAEIDAVWTQEDWR